MATYKRTSGDYAITTIDSAANVVVTTNTVKINGNLDVSGNLTYIEVSELNIQDPFIVLNASNTSSYSSNSGVLTHTANTTYAGIRYNNTSAQWQVTTNTDVTGLTGSWTPVATGNISIAGSNTEVQFNDAGNFGASSAFTWTRTNNMLKVGGNLTLANIGTTPTGVANTVTLYNNTMNSGGTGLYVVTPSTVSDELIAAKKAKLYALIF